MKTFLVSAVAALAFLYQPSAHAQAPAAPVTPASIKLGKVMPEGVKSPEYQIVGGPQKRSKIGTWLEIEVEYETKADEIPELKFDYVVAIENKLATGSVTYIAIPKGRDHFAVMYIAPRALEKLTDGKQFNAGSLQNVWVTVSTGDGVKLGETALKPGPIPNVGRIAGLILNKNETPFAPLFYDRYEAIKAGPRQ